MLSYSSKKLTRITRLNSLNPCSNGICSLTFMEAIFLVGLPGVLILVLMEYALLQMANMLTVLSGVMS